MGQKVASTWVNKVVTLLKMDESGQVELFQKQPVTEWKKQVKLRKDQIKKLSEQQVDRISDWKEQMAELQEQLDNAFITVDVKMMANLDSRKAYFSTYNANIDRAYEAVQALKATMEEDGKTTSKTIERLEEEITRFEYKLKEIG